MSWHLSRWIYLSQVIVQRVTLASILSLAVAGCPLESGRGSRLSRPGSRWTWALAARSPSTPGFAVQLALTLLLLGLCFFIP